MGRCAAIGEKAAADPAGPEAADQDAADADRMDKGRAVEAPRMLRPRLRDPKARERRACWTMMAEPVLRPERVLPAQAILNNCGFDSKVWQRATAVVVNTDGGKRRSSCRRFFGLPE